MSDTVSPTARLSLEAFLSNLYREHFGVVRQYLVRRLGCPEAGREAAQDVFLRLLLWPQVTTIENPRGFLLKTARNLAIDLLRAESACPPLESIADHEDILLDPVSDPGRIAEARQQLQVVAAGIEALPAKCRHVFFLFRFEALRQREIAERLGISPKMVEAHLARAMSHLRRCWGD